MGGGGVFNDARSDADGAVGGTAFGYRDSHGLGAAWVAAMAAVFNAMRVDRGLRPVDLQEGLEPEHAPHLASGNTGDEGTDPSPG